MDEEWLQDNDIPMKRRTSHIRSCCADGCTSKGYRLLVDGERVQYFPFPLYDQDMCHRWAQSLRLPSDSQFSKTYVCSKHFRPTDYKARNHDDGKKTLRRTALPSCEPVVNTGKTPVRKKKVRTSDFDSTDEETDDYEDNTEVTTLFTKNAKDGDTLSVLVVKDPDEDNEPEEESKVKLKVLEESKKAPLLIQNLLDLGPPFPWRKHGIEAWTNERIIAHTEQLEKIQLAFVEEQEKIKILQQQVEAGREILALAVIKRTMGRQVLSQFLRTLP